LAQVEELLGKARNAFDEGDLKVCIQMTQDALDRYDAGPAFYFTSEKMANGLLVLALAYEKAKQAGKAKALYNVVVSRWPEHEAAALVSQKTGAQSVVAGVVVATKGEPRLAVARFDAPSGRMARGFVVPAGKDVSLERALVPLAHALTGPADDDLDPQGEMG